MKQTTLCLLIKEDKILLAMKKRGFGQGRWNGAGGKFDAEKGDKTILDAAIRETEEEIGVKIKKPEQVALFHFTFPHKPEWDQDVSLFLAKDWQGEPQESEEMKPAWFAFSDIPYDNMWPDDTYWMPHILQGKKVEADFSFGEGDKLLDHKIKVIENI
jgi:8-oxo-dGTP pyrophosphatase MutT (NUDIX family)